MSPALRELEAEGLILQAKSENSKTKRYQAEEDVAKVVYGVLKRREKPMIEQISKSHSKLQEQNKGGKKLNLKRLEKLGSMIQMAEIGLETLLAPNQSWWDHPEKIPGN